MHFFGVRLYTRGRGGVYLVTKVHCTRKQDATYTPPRLKVIVMMAHCTAHTQIKWLLGHVATSHFFFCCERAYYAIISWLPCSVLLHCLWEDIS